MDHEQHVREATETPQEIPRSTRRNLLRLAGGAMAGTAAAALVTERAAADNGLTVATGGATTSDEVTKVTYSGTTAGAGHLFLFRSGTDTTDSTSTGPKAVLIGSSNSSNHAAIAGIQNVNGGTAGYFRSLGGTGVLADCTNGQAATLMTSSGTSVQLICQEAGDHVIFAGGPTSTSPVERTAVSDTPGQMTRFSGGDLWYCIASGAPGSWRKIIGPSTAGAFHPIATARVYDSRKDMTPMPNGPLATGESRVLFVGAKRDPSSGAVTVANAVPSGTTAVAYNLTIVSTVGTNGFLSVEPGGVSTPGGSAINWSAAGLTLANASVVKLDIARQLRVSCGGTATSCHFIIDVVGYYQ